MSKTLATLETLESELATFSNWYDSNPMKSVLVDLTKRDIAYLKAKQESEASTQAYKARTQAYNALPWFKRLFRSA